MPSAPSAGLLVYRRLPSGRGHADAVAEVLLLAPRAGRSRRAPSALRRQALEDEAAARRGVRPPRGAHRVPSWECRPATADTLSGIARPPGAVAAAELSIEERLRRRPRGRKPTSEQLVETARRGFAADFGLLLDPPFISLGGVKQRHHRLLHVWAHEIDDAGVEAVARSLADARAAVFLELAEAREVVVAPQRRFVDQLEALLWVGGAADR